MATYKKPAITVNGKTLNGLPFFAHGEAYESLKAHKTAEIKSVRNVVLIPFHAVKQYVKIVISDDVEVKDAYCG